jgi:peroxin-6
VDDKVKAINEARAKESPPSPPRTVAWFFDHEAGPQDIEVVVDEEDFEAARREMVPSVSVKELEHYERVRKTFEEGGDAAKQEKKQQKIPQRSMPLMAKAVGKKTDEDIVAATEALSLNGHANGVYGSSASAKGKGKAVLRPDDETNGFGDATNGDADLY